MRMRAPYWFWFAWGLDTSGAKKQPAFNWSNFPNFGGCISVRIGSPWVGSRKQETQKGVVSMSVQRETMSEELEQERPWEAHAWLRAETLAAMAELLQEA